MAKGRGKRRGGRRRGEVASEPELTPTAGELAELARAIAGELIPEPWLAEGLQLIDDSHPAEPGRRCTALIAADPRGRKQPLLLAEAMELASWESAASGSLQTSLCSDPICGIEGCEPGNWISLRRYPAGVELGISAERDDTDPWAWREYRPPWWLSELGPCRITDADWEQLVQAAEGRGLKLPAAGLLAASP